MWARTAATPISPRSIRSPAHRSSSLRAAGWGSGWAAGNTLFLPTVGVYFPFAAIRTVQPSEAVGTDYAFEVTARGDVDRAPTNPVI